MSAKYIIVAGGVISGCGKGVAAASIALLMKQRGHSVNCIKFDPYLNVNAGIMSPHEHGEVWVTDAGEETDMDLGHYYRIAGVDGKIYTSGTLYKELIHEQENGKWLGQTIQIIPHVTNKIIEQLESLGKQFEIVVAEIGGTIGDVESGGFYEAIRQFKQKHRDECLVVMVAPILWVNTIQEFKTKPLQRSVKDLQSHSLQPDILLCRVDRQVPEKLLDKIANLTSLPRESVFDAPDVPSIYQVPVEFYNRHIDDLVADYFHLPRKGCRIHKYRELVEKQTQDLPEIEIGIFGKYSNCSEAYVSLKEALCHAGIANDVKVKIRWHIAEKLEEYKDMRGVQNFFTGLDGIIIPGGFDTRGIEGKMRAIRYVREKSIPFLGICLGLQCAVIEFARNVCNLTDANSMEFDADTKHPVVHYVEGQKDLMKKSGTMRLGAYNCSLLEDSLAFDVYGKKTISERHRHRYEVNPTYLSEYAKRGLIVSGTNPESGLIEIMELDSKIHPYFIGTQAHPEFQSKLVEPAPLFNGLVKAALAHKRKLADG